MPNGLLMLQNSFDDFVFEHRSGCCATESGRRGYWRYRSLIDWYVGTYSVYFQKSGIAFKLDHTLPNLVNLNEDPQLSEMLLYVIRAGETHVGRMREDAAHEIQLNGPLIADNHWWERQDHLT